MIFQFSNIKGLIFKSTKSINYDTVHRRFFHLTIFFKGVHRTSFEVKILFCGFLTHKKIVTQSSISMKRPNN